MTARRKDDLYQEIARVVLEQALPYLPDWIKTLGAVGKSPEAGERSGVSPNVRVNAAKHGVELVTKFIGSAEGSAAGNALLQELQGLESLVDNNKASLREDESPPPTTVE